MIIPLMKKLLKNYIIMLFYNKLPLLEKVKMKKVK